MTAAMPMSAPGPLQRTDFSVPGMRCAGCISKLETGLALQPAIVAARVNFTAKRVTVTHLPETDKPALLAAFTRLGFEATSLGVGACKTVKSRSRENAQFSVGEGGNAIGVFLCKWAPKKV